MIFSQIFKKRTLDRKKVPKKPRKNLQLSAILDCSLQTVSLGDFCIILPFSSSFHPCIIWRACTSAQGCVSFSFSLYFGPKNMPFGPICLCGDCISRSPTPHSYIYFISIYLPCIASKEMCLCLFLHPFRYLYNKNMRFPHICPVPCRSRPVVNSRLFPFWFFE